MGFVGGELDTELGREDEASNWDSELRMEGFGEERQGMRSWESERRWKSMKRVSEVWGGLLLAV